MQTFKHVVFSGLAHCPIQELLVTQLNLTNFILNKQIITAFNPVEISTILNIASILLFFLCLCVCIYMHDLTPNDAQ